MSPPILIKKYGNRRLYDTAESRYITLEELAAIIQAGSEVRVVDAKSGADLTQATLTQIIIESRDAARMLPVPLLTQLIRLGDDALAEFLGFYLSNALEMYMQARRGLQAAAVYNPFAQVPLSATEALARMWMASPFGGGPPPPAAAPSPAASHNGPPAAEPDRADVSGQRNELAELRRELDELKRSVHGKKRRR
jgi:polyhydroxyalkanoate synthesis repressor PhaR